jgi:hypothetical protein
MMQPTNDEQLVQDQDHAAKIHQEELRQKRIANLRAAMSPLQRSVSCEKYSNLSFDRINDTSINDNRIHDNRIYIHNNNITRIIKECAAPEEAPDTDLAPEEAPDTDLAPEEAPDTDLAPEEAPDVDPSPYTDPACLLCLNDSLPNDDDDDGTVTLKCAIRMDSRCAATEAKIAPFLTTAPYLFAIAPILRRTDDTHSSVGYSLGHAVFASMSNEIYKQQ